MGAGVPHHRSLSMTTKGFRFLMLKPCREVHNSTVHSRIPERGTKNLSDHIELEDI